MRNISRTLAYRNNGFTLIEVMVALSILALAVGGLAQLHYTAYQHIRLTQEMQQASYFADSHLHALASNTAIVKRVETGEYTRGEGVGGYPWRLTLVALNEQSLWPKSTSLSDKVAPLTADLSVWIDHGTRELKFHTLLLARPEAQPDQQSDSRSLGKLGAKK